MPSMKLDKEAREDWEERMESEPEPPEYPYGLRLILGKEELEKLGLKDCKVGAEYSFRAVAVVKEKMERESDEGEMDHKSVDMQITDMEIIPDDGGEGRADRMYGENS